MTSPRLHFGDLTLQGISIAGDQTWLRVSPPGLAFDVGRGEAPLVGAGDLFLSHGHLDHSLGVPFLLSQRRLQGLAPTRVFCPRDTAGPLEDLLRAAERLEGESFEVRVTPLVGGDRIRVGPRLEVEAFATDHVVESLGYHLVRRKRKLAARLRGKRSEEIAEMSRRGEPVHQEEDELLLSYCGDTGPAVFDLEPRLFASQVLVIECTFLGPEDRARGARYRHIHLDDLAQRSDRFRNRALVLHHFSRRYHQDQIRHEVYSRLAALGPEVHLLGIDPPISTEEGEDGCGGES